MLVQATSIYDQVKGEFFAQYTRTRVAYEDCLKRRGEERDERRDHLFKAMVIATALDLLPKIEYVKKPSKYRDLAALLGEEIDSKKFDFAEAERLFRLERELLEENGVTKYEYEKISPESYTLRRAAVK